MEELLSRLLAGESLSFDEAREVLGAMMRGELADDLIATVLLTLKGRGETPAEIGGAARALQEAAVAVETSRRPLLDTCGTGGDGLETINVSTASAVLLAACGVAVAKHGNRAVSSKAGSADVLEALGVTLDLGPAANARLLDELGIAFLFAPRYHPATKHVMPIRQRLKTRTLFNLIGPLSNPARPTAQVLGVYDPDLLAPMAGALRDLGLERALVVHGAGGMDELSLHGPTRMVRLEGDTITEERLEPATLGLEPAGPEALQGGDAADNARLLRDVLGGRDTGPRAQIVALNTAAALILAGVAADWAAGLAHARDRLASGEAEALLDRWAQATQDLAGAE